MCGASICTRLVRAGSLRICTASPPNGKHMRLEGAVGLTRIDKSGRLAACGAFASSGFVCLTVCTLVNLVTLCVRACACVRESSFGV